MNHFLRHSGLGTPELLLLIIFFFLILIFVAPAIIGLWKIFTKAGKPGWACIVPIYNIVVLLEIVGKPAWWILLMLIPIVNIVFSVIVYHRLSIVFGKDSGFTFGIIFLPMIFIPILGFGKAVYQPQRLDY